MAFIVTFMVASAMLYLQLGCYSSSYIHQTVTGGLRSVWRIWFDIKVEDLNGVIIYGVDYERNQFAMDVVRGGDGERLIRIKFIKMFAVVPLIDLCRCERCRGNMFIFYIVINSEEMKIQCYNNEYYHLNDTGGSQQIYDGVGARIDYPMPLSMVNQRNKTFIMMGNIGPIIAEGNVTVPPLDEQMVGCLRYFIYNAFGERFIEEGSQMRASCPRRCYHGLCNDGKCDVDGYLAICDCSLTVLSGLYCNRTLQRYTDGGFNIYKRNKGRIERASMKISWRVSSASRYCLAEVAGGGGLSTFVIEGDRLLLDSKNISRTEIFAANFLRIDIGFSNYTIETKYAQSKGSFPLRITHINIGFSEKSGFCQSFEGLYDVDVIEGDLRQSRRLNKSHRGSAANAFITVITSVAIGIGLVCTTIYVVRRIKGTRPDRNIYELQDVENAAPQIRLVAYGEYDELVDPNDQNPRPISGEYDKHVGPSDS